jgi:hypothetical protein
MQFESDYATIVGLSQLERGKIAAKFIAKENNPTGKRIAGFIRRGDAYQLLFQDPGYKANKQQIDAVLNPIFAPYLNAGEVDTPDLNETVTDDNPNGGRRKKYQRREPYTELDKPLTGGRRKTRRRKTRRRR